MWGGTFLCTRRADSLIQLQRKIIENLFSRHFPNSRCLNYDAQILRMDDVYRMRVGIYMYRVVMLGECPDLRANLDLRLPDHEYSTRSAGELMLPLPRTEVIRLNLRYQFINVWRSIPHLIRESASITIFKKSLTKYYLDQYLP